MEKRIKTGRCEGEGNKKLFLWYYQLGKTIGEGRILVNPYDGNTVKKMVAFLKGWDVNIVPYAESWKLCHFNQVKHKTIRTLREELSTELKKKAAKVCITQNVLPGHMT